MRRTKGPRSAAWAADEQPGTARGKILDRDQFPAFEVTSPDSTVGVVHGVALGEARLWRVRIPGPSAVRSRSSADCAPCASFVLQLEGSHTTVERARSWDVHSGQLSICRRNRENECFTEAASSHLHLQLPWRSIEAEHPRLAREYWRVLPADEPGVALLRALMLSALEAGPNLDATQRRVTGAALLQLLGVPFARVSLADRHEWRVQRALSDIERLLHDPTLDAEAIADCQGIGRRRLDMLLVDTIGMTVSSRISARRIAHAARLLQDPASAERSVAEIAFAVGFQNATHFSRAFKAHFKLSPKEWRSRHRA
jgi:AraC family transcriptional regulator, positive regulator of tynA and feaB